MKGFLITLAQAAADTETPLPTPEPTAGNDNIWPGMMMAAGGMILLFIIMANLRKKVSARQANQVNPREAIEESREKNERRNDLRRMSVEFEEMTRRFAAQLDAKATKLERLLDEADAKIAELKSLTGKPESSGGASAPDDRVQEVPAKAEPQELHPMAPEVYRLADTGLSPIEIAQELGEHVGNVELILALRQQNV